MKGTKSIHDEYTHYKNLNYVECIKLYPFKISNTFSSLNNVGGILDSYEINTNNALETILNNI
jgi:hypothetical protein